MNYAEPLGDIWKYDPEYNRAADFLGIDKHQREDVKVAKKLSFLVDWALASSKSTKQEDALWTINDLRKKLGINSQGETMLGQLFEFVRLKQDRERKEPEVPYEQVINQMIQAKREDKIRSEEENIKRDVNRTNSQIKHDQSQAELHQQETISEYKKSFAPEKKLEARVIAPVDHTPIIQPL